MYYCYIVGATDPTDGSRHGWIITLQVLVVIVIPRVLGWSLVTGITLTQVFL